jgi:predicted transcriptional regulator YdeE
MSVSKPELVKVDGFSVVGLQVRTKNADEFNPQTAKLHQLWEQFAKTQIPHRKPTSPMYGIYSNYASDFNDFYSVTASVEVNSDEEPGEAFKRVNVQQGDYLVFKNTGPIPQAIHETWAAIWDYFKANPAVARAYTTDFEVCAAPEQCEIYIGIKNSA